MVDSDLDYYLTVQGPTESQGRYTERKLLLF